MTRHLTVEDLAERWCTTPKAVWNKRHRGELPPALRIGRKLLWSEAAIAAFEQARTEGTAPELTTRPSTRTPAPPKDYRRWFKEGRPA